MAVSNLVAYYSDEGDGWNDLEITARGMKLRAVLNGVCVMEYDGDGTLNDETHRKRNVSENRHTALQIHKGDELKIRFKDIMIKESREERLSDEHVTEKEGRAVATQ